MRFLITAGPTREYLDPVRFLSNSSTGRMGYACAAAAVKRGHKVTLVSGPVELKKPQGVKLIEVITSAEMAQALFDRFGRCDCVIMAAAVSDYRPKRARKYKIKKASATLTLQLERTQDILAELGRRKQNRVLIGFALQDRAGRQNARRKLKDKNLDVIVLNHPAAMGAEISDVEILRCRGRWESYQSVPKTMLATKLIRIAEQIAAPPSPTGA